MLGSYMEDIGITPEQFEAACGVASKKIKTQFHQSLFEQASYMIQFHESHNYHFLIFHQVWAADDYEIFKRMMIQKNIELQLQALELLQQRYESTEGGWLIGQDELVSCSSEYSTRWLAIK
jgi:hypothetical protein